MAECIRAAVELLRLAFGQRHVHRHLVAVVTFPDAEGEAALFEIVDAIDALRFFLRGSERRQKHRRKDGNDGDDNKWHDESESAGLGVHVRIIAQWFFISSCY